MNNQRNINYLLIIALLSINVIFGITWFAGYLSSANNPLGSIVFLIGMSCTITISVISMIFSIIIYTHTKKDYDEQFEEYNIEFIRVNQKREQSALLMTAISAILFYPIFPMINAWIKSGLNKKEREHAKREIRVKRVDKFLKQDAVIEHLKNHKKEKELIEQTINIREKKLDTKFNCNLYILKILNEINAPYEIIYNVKEVYYLGMNY